MQSFARSAQGVKPAESRKLRKFERDLIFCLLVRHHTRIYVPFHFSLCFLFSPFMEDINLERKESEAFSSQTNGDPADDTSRLYNRRKSKTESSSTDESEGDKTQQHDPAATKDNTSKKMGWLNALRPPPFAQMRKTIKVSIALLIALVMTLDDRCREAVGSGSLLVCIVLVFYFPSRTVGMSL